MNITHFAHDPVEAVATDGRLDSQTLAEAIAARAHADPQQTVITFLTATREQLPLRRIDLHRRAIAAQERLRSWGARPGRLVVLHGRHGPDLVIAFTAALYLGAIPALAPYKPRPVHGGVPNDAVVIDIETLPLDEASDGSVAATSPDAPAYVQFSSGTTGDPKGAIISNRAILSYLRRFAATIALEPDSVIGSWVPYHHDLGLVLHLLMPLTTSSTAVTIPPATFVVNPGRFLRALSDHRATTTAMPNFGFAHILNRVTAAGLDGLDLACLRYLGAGGEPNDAAVLSAFVERLAPSGLSPNAICPGYGMAECVLGATSVRPGTGVRSDLVSRDVMHATGVAAPARPDSSDAIAVVSCGRPLGDTRVTIRDDGGIAVAERVVGEIVIAAPDLFCGYWNEDGRNGTPVVTGDLGYMADGELFVVGRKKDVVIRAGENLHPVWIERVASDALGRRCTRAAAFGVRQPDSGSEDLVIVCEIRGATTPGDAELVRDHVRRLVGIEPADVQIAGRGAIELTTSGKIARNQTRARYLSTRRSSSSAGPVPDLRQILEAETGLVVHGDTNLLEAGADSLGLLRFVLAVERATGRTISSERWVMQPTLIHMAELSGLAAPAAAVADHSSVPTESPAVVPRPPSRHWLSGSSLKARGPVVGSIALPYRLGTLMLRASTRIDWVRRLLYRQEVDDLTALHGHVPPVHVVRAFIEINTWAVWRLRQIHHAGGFGKRVRWRGLEHLDAALAVGRGVIVLAPHTPVLPVLNTAPRLRELPWGVIGRLGPRTLRLMGLPALADAKARSEIGATGSYTAQLHYALTVLKAGGVVVLAPDVEDGTGGVEFKVGHTVRSIRPGFVEIANRSNTPVVPVFAAMMRDGTVEMSFLPALPEGAGSHQLHAYAGVFADQWLKYLAAAEWKIVRQSIKSRARAADI